ncbi:Solute carrier family 40 member [Lachnellula suecica]|uniref:Solute carrier family 40 member n=1 Tax=Lachnellula suecica TaxID=602035 RepID=A0A8T9C607_9HELO|nr:Solute carrier family 40 member [Lachnellula suecica]
MASNSVGRSLSISSTSSAEIDVLSSHTKRHRHAGTHPGQGSARDDDVDAPMPVLTSSEESIEVFPGTASGAIGRSKWWRVYMMHFLFMWNSRTYEYVSIFLVAFAFPKSLTATSIRGLASTISALLCSSSVGSWIDRSPLRLNTLLIAVCLNHAAIVAAYLCWLLWPSASEDPNATLGPFSDLSKGLLFGGILFLDIVHDLSTIGYRLCLERDWVPVLVGPIHTEMDHGLTQVNAVMMRIELVCKLVAPSLMPLIVKSFASQTGWIILLAVSTLVFWASGVWCVRVIAQGNVRLTLPKQIFTTLNEGRTFSVNDNFTFPQMPSKSWQRKAYGFLYRDPIMRLKHYFSFPIWPASISIALLQLTVLAYSATLITYLLSVGFSLSAVTIARASGSIFGLSGTVITPAAVAYLKKRHASKITPQGDRIDDNDKTAEAAVTRAVGFWGVGSQFLCLVVNGLAEVSPHISVTLLLFAFLSLSRIGHFVHFLMIQELGQVEIPAAQRSTFAGVEQSFKSLGELSHWIATVVWSQPEDFKWLALGSMLVTGLSSVVFGTWARKGQMGRNAISGGYEAVPLVDVNGEEDEAPP